MDEDGIGIRTFNKGLAAALNALEEGEVALREATAKLERRLDEHARFALEKGLIERDSHLRAHRQASLRKW